MKIGEAKKHALSIRAMVKQFLNNNPNEVYTPEMASKELVKQSNNISYDRWVTNAGKIDNSMRIMYNGGLWLGSPKAIKKLRS